MIGHRYTLARYHSDFYCRNYHKALRAIVASIILMLFLLIVITYMIFTRTPPVYYANTTSGHIIPMTPLTPNG